MSVEFDDLTVVNDSDAVGAFNGREAMGDDDGGDFFCVRFFVFTRAD